MCSQMLWLRKRGTKLKTWKTMCGRKTIVLSLHSSQTWTDENRNPNLFRQFRREAGLIAPSIQTAIWQKTDIGCDVSSQFGFSSLFCWPSAMPLKRKRVRYLQGGMFTMRDVLLGAVLTWQRKKKSRGGAGVSVSGSAFRTWLRADYVYLFYVYLKLLHHWLLDTQCLIAVRREECKLHFQHYSSADQMQILGGYRACSAVPVKRCFIMSNV